MVKSSKLALLLAVLFIISVFFTACQSSMQSQESTVKSTSATSAKETKKEETVNKSEPVTLAVWDTWTDGEMFQRYEEFNKKFEQKNPNIKIKRTTIAWKDTSKVLLPALNSGNGPDAFVPGDIATADTKSIAENGIFLNLDKYSETFKWKDRFQDWYYQQMMDAFGGHIYKVNLGSTALGVFYNKKILSDNGISIPKTYTEFKNVCETLKQKGIQPITLPSKDGWPVYHYESLFIAAFTGKDVMQGVLNKGESFNKPEVIKALTAFKELIDKGYTSPKPNALPYDEANKEFMAGGPKGPAMILTGTWQITNYSKNMGDNVGFFAFPAIDGKETMPVAGLADSWAASGKTKYPDQAAAYIDAVSAPDNMELIGICGLIPGFKGINNSQVDALNINGLMKDAFKNLMSAKDIAYNIDVYAPPTVNEATKNMMQQLIDGKKSPEDVVKSIDKAYSDSKAKK